MVHPAPNGLVGDHDAAFRQQIFDVAKAQGKPDVKPDRLLDDFQREPVPLVADFLHPPGYLTASGTASPNRRDGVDGARTGISLNEELCQDGCR